MTDLTELADLEQAFVVFRRGIREAMYAYYPNNPGSTDEELIAVVKEMANKLAEGSPHVAYWREQVAKHPVSDEWRGALKAALDTQQEGHR